MTKQDEASLLQLQIEDRLEGIGSSDDAINIVSNFISLGIEEETANKILTKMLPDHLKFSIQDLQSAFESGFYEGAGDDAWYRDHATPEGELTKNALVHRPWKEHMLEVLKISLDT